MYSAMDYIYEIYREKSFTKAAQKLFVSQPALSASVKKVEDELGAELFDRHTSPISLTEAGKIYIEAAEQIYAAKAALKERIDDINGLRTGEVTAGGTNFVSSCVIPEIVKNYSAKFPGIALNLVESNSEELKRLALSGGVDAVIDYDFDDMLFDITPLREEIIYLSAAKDSPQAKKFGKFALTYGDIKQKRETRVPAIEASMLAGESVLLLKKGNDMHDKAAKIFHESVVRPHVVLMLDQLMTSYTLSCKGLGMAFVPDTLIEAAPLKNAVYFRILSPHAKRTLAIAKKKNKYAGKALTQFIITAVESFNKK